MKTTIQVRKRGALTLPSELRMQYGIREGDLLRIVDLDGVFILTPLTATVTDLAHEIESVRLEAGLTTEDLLAGLREQRIRYHRETFGE